MSAATTYHRLALNPAKNLYTNRYLFRKDVLPGDDEQTKQETNTDITSLQSMASELRGRYPGQQSTAAKNSDLVIDYLEGDCRWGYYFASKIEETVFWVDDISVEYMVKDAYTPVQSGEHLGQLFTCARRCDHQNPCFLDILRKTCYWCEI